MQFVKIILMRSGTFSLLKENATPFEVNIDTARSLLTKKSNYSIIRMQKPRRGGFNKICQRFWGYYITV